ncbi:ETS-related transcription factor Elf-3-like [Macrobrachium nipponense]|uniref:ETS-related transcription factor Elf-3-like n=1 Tax=Macrobrachium nipponense TaxID=159736 RepID=UPI0030C81283
MASSGDDYSHLEPSLLALENPESGDDLPALYDLYLRDRSPISQQLSEELDDCYQYERRSDSASSSSYADWGVESPSYDQPPYGANNPDSLYPCYPEDSRHPEEDQALASMPALEGSLQSLRFHDPYGTQVQYEDDYSREHERDTNRLLPSDGSEELFTRIPSTRKSRKRGPKSWEFLYRLLSNPEYNPSLIRWEDPTTATFRLVQPETIAQMWGTRNEQPNLSYNNFARSLRYHYKSGILIQVSDRQLVYRFGEIALENIRASKK